MTFTMSASNLQQIWKKTWVEIRVTPKLLEKQRLHIATSLSPCSSHHDIIVKLYTVDGRIKKSKPMRYTPLSLKDIHLCKSCSKDSTPGLSEELAADSWCKVVRRIDGSLVHFPDENSSSSLNSDEDSSLTASDKSSDEVINCQIY